MYLRGAQFCGEKGNSRGIAQEIHLPTSQAGITEFFQYVVRSGNRFNKVEVDARGEQNYRSAASYSCRCRFSFVYAMNRS
jgi:hypothetical protein